MAGITIKDIASMAKVSTGTVDRVLHNRGGVSIQSKTKVEKALKKLNYTPNLVARGLALKDSYKIAIILPKFDQDEYWKQQIIGIKRAYKEIQNFGFTIKMYNYDFLHQGSLDAIIKRLKRHKVHAAIVAVESDQESKKLFCFLEDNHVFYIQINAHIERANPNFLSFVGQDSFQSGRLAAMLLNYACHINKDFAILHMEEYLATSPHLNKKQSGFLTYLEDQKLKSKVVIKHIQTVTQRDELRKVLKGILSKNKKLGGLFISTSRVHAVGEILIELKRTDIVLVGFDLLTENIEILKKYPKMFIINQNASLQGFYAMQFLFKHLMQNQNLEKIKYLPLDIVTKENLINHLHMQQRDKLISAKI